MLGVEKLAGGNVGVDVEEDGGGEEKDVESGDGGRGAVVADETALDRIPSDFWSMTTPTDVRPLCNGMNHAQPDSSVHNHQYVVEEDTVKKDEEGEDLPLNASKNGAFSRGVPFPYIPASRQYPHTATFLSDWLYRRFFRYLHPPSSHHASSPSPITSIQSTVTQAHMKTKRTTSSTPIT